MSVHRSSARSRPGPAPSRRARLRLAAAVAGGLLAAAPAAAQYQPSLPSVARQPAAPSCCQPYDARGAARGLSLQQQQTRTPIPAPPRVESLAPDAARRPAPVETRPGMALEGTASGGAGTVYDGASRELFRPVKPPAPLD